MERCMTMEEIDEVLDSVPRAYPSAVKMDTEATHKHVMCGRQFEIAMLCYQVTSCACCGFTQPWHDYDDFPKDDIAPYTRKHLSSKYHPAWHCTCNNVCHGSQFYADAKPKHKAWFKSKHSGMSPSDALGLPSPNAMICRSCYDEVSAKGVDQNGNSTHFLFTFIIFFRHLIMYSSPHHRTHVWLQVLYAKWFWASPTHTATGSHCTSPPQKCSKACRAYGSTHTC